MLWDTKFREHELWRIVAAARDSMNGTTAPEDRAEHDALDYAVMVLELLEQRRDDTDGREVSPAMLTSTRDQSKTPFCLVRRVAYVEGQNGHRRK